MVGGGGEGVVFFSWEMVFHKGGMMERGEANLTRGKAFCDINLN